MLRWPKESTVAWVRPYEARSLCLAARVLGAALVSWLSLSLFDSGSARAGGGVIPDMGIRKTAMGAVIGRPDELAAIYHNPAGLVLSPGTNIFVSGSLALLNTDIRLRPWKGSDAYIKAPVDADGYYPEVQPSRAFGVVPMVVASTNLWSKDVVAALGFYVPNAVGAAFKEDSVARYHLIEGYSVAAAGTLSVAYRPLPWLSIGGGVSLYYLRLHARRKLFPVFDGRDLGALFGSQTDLEIGGDDVTFGFNLGVLLQPIPSLSIGAAMISRSNVTFEGDFALRLGSDSARPNTTLSGTQRTESLLPWTFQFGANYDIFSWLEIGAEFRYWVMSQVDEQRTQIEGLDLLPELVLPRNYHDSWHASGGFNFHLPWVAGLELMTGVHYDRSPAPAKYMSIEQPLFSHVGWHVGARYRFGRWSLGASYARFWYLQRRTDESVGTPPSNYIASSTSHFFGLVMQVRIAPGFRVPAQQASPGT